MLCYRVRTRSLSGRSNDDSAIHSAAADEPTAERHCISYRLPTEAINNGSVSKIAYEGHRMALIALIMALSLPLTVAACSSGSPQTAKGLSCKPVPISPNHPPIDLSGGRPGVTAWTKGAVSTAQLGDWENRILGPMYGGCYLLLTSQMTSAGLKLTVDVSHSEATSQVSELADAFRRSGLFSRVVVQTSPPG